MRGWRRQHPQQCHSAAVAYRAAVKQETPTACATMPFMRRSVPRAPLRNCAQLRGASIEDGWSCAWQRGADGGGSKGGAADAWQPALQRCMQQQCCRAAARPESARASEPAAAARAAAQRSAAFAAGRALPRFQTSSPDWPRGASSRVCARPRQAHSRASPARNVCPQRSCASCGGQRRVPRRAEVTPRRGAAARRQRDRHRCHATRELPFTPQAKSPCARARVLRWPRARSALQARQHGAERAALLTALLTRHAWRLGHRRTRAGARSAGKGTRPSKQAAWSTAMPSRGSRRPTL